MDFNVLLIILIFNGLSVFYFPLSVVSSSFAKNPSSKIRQKRLCKYINYFDISLVFIDFFVNFPD